MLDLAPTLEHAIIERAEASGLTANQYIEKLLAADYAASVQAEAAVEGYINATVKLVRAEMNGKPYRAMQFSGIAPTSRTAEEIDADIRAARDEWDERENAWRAAPASPAIP
jgi:hypothetical protein